MTPNEATKKGYTIYTTDRFSLLKSATCVVTLQEKNKLDLAVAEVKAKIDRHLSSGTINEQNAFELNELLTDRAGPIYNLFANVFVNLEELEKRTLESVKEADEKNPHMKHSCAITQPWRIDPQIVETKLNTAVEAFVNFFDELFDNYNYLS